MHNKLIWVVGIVLLIILVVSAYRWQVTSNTNATRSATVTCEASACSNAAWGQFVKPGADELKQQLTAMQYAVTQRDGTEPPFDNAYYHNEAEGIYVDVVSGEPLFSSKDKYDSGTGWPSFVKPIAEDVVVYNTDTLLVVPRTEVRSRFANSHLGHVFDDGPMNRGGKRYCMNSAALRFIPKADMTTSGYQDYIIYL